MREREREKDFYFNLWFYEKKCFVPDLLENFLKIKQTLWRHDNSLIKSARIGVLSTYVLNGSKYSKYTKFLSIK